MIKRFLSYLILISVFFQNTFFIIFAEEQAENQIQIEQIENLESIQENSVNPENDFQIPEIINSGTTEQTPENTVPEIDTGIPETNTGSTEQSPVSETNILIIENTNTGTTEQIPENTNSGIVEQIQETNSGFIETNSGNTEQILQAEFQNRFNLEFQNPSYILSGATENEFLCDRTKSDCKINFNIDDLELTSFSTKFYCKSDFGFITGEEDKCNPSTIIFGTGIFNLNFKVFKKADDSLVWQKDIKIENNPQILETNSLITEQNQTSENIETSSWNTENSNSWNTENLENTNSGTTQNSTLETNHQTTENTSSENGENSSFGIIENTASGDIIIPNPIIDIQSGLINTDKSDRFKCKNLDCSMNLTAENSFSGVLLEKNYFCLWDFGGGTFSSSDTPNKCNPSYVKYGTGSFKISLKIFEKDNSINFLEKTIFIENLEIINSKTISNIVEQKYNSPPFANIILQGKQAKYKTIEDNKIICNGVDECSVNFSGEGSFDLEKDKLSYFWDFGNGEYFVGKNPTSIFYKPGKYSVILEVRDDKNISKASFIVEVREEKIEEKLFIQDKNIVSSLKIYGVLANSSGKDDFEYIILENTGQQELNLFGLIIDDEIGKGSKAYTIDYNLILKAGQKKKLYKSETGLIFGNTSDSANIIYDNKIIDSLSWNFVIAENFLITKDILSSALQKVFVSKVIDGDTIEVEFENGTREKLRFIGVDTPETKHPKKPVEEFGLEASAFTKASLFGKYIYLDIPGLNRDKYNRLLAYIYLNDNQNETSFNEILIQKGLARAYLRFQFSKYDSFEKTEKDAKKAKIGMWGNKEVLEYVKELEKQEELELEEEKKKEIYDFSFLLGNFDFYEFLDKSYAIKNDLYKNIQENHIKNFKKLFSFDFKKIKEIKTKKVSFKTSDKIVKETEKTLKSSISYKISKQKKAFKISGKSDIYKDILMVFGDKKIYLKTNDIGEFLYETKSVQAGIYKLEFYGIDKFGEIFLKIGREFELASDYVANAKKTKIKKAKIKKQKDIDIIYKNISYPSLSTIKINKIIYLFLGIFFIILLFLLLRKRGFLED